ncbi:MAG: hypothetical protein ACOX1L_08055 [Erysipelotrichaceae bacterium]|jgi:hypothetical protein
MNKTNLNKPLGTKWFTFYTKIRPWIIIVFGFKTYFEFLSEVNHDITLWSLLLFLFVTLAHSFLCILVFNISSGNYNRFYHFVRWVLLFEVIAPSYQAGFIQYARNADYGYAFMTFFMGLLLFSFFWYLPNIIYFKKRVLTVTD